MLSAEQLLAALEEKGLLRAQLLERIRLQLAQSGEPISAAALAKQLIDKGHLQRAQVEPLLEGGGAKPPPLEKKAEPAGSASLFDEEFPATEPAATTAKPDAASPAHGKTSKGPSLEPGKSASGVAGGTRRPALDQLPPAGQRPLRPQGGRKRVLYVVLGLAAAMVLIVGIVVVQYSYSGGQEDLKEAEAAYQAGSFAQAADAYDRFLAKSSRSEDASRARVRRGLCRLHQPIDGRRDWPVAAALAVQVAAEIGPEPALNDARKQFGDLLAAIADGMAERVRKNPNPDAMAETRRMLDLINRYVPRGQRNRAVVADVEVVLAIARRRIDRPSAIDRAVAAIRLATSQGKPQEVYALRTALGKTYPDVGDDARLGEALLAAARAEGESVKKEERRQAASTVEAAGPVVAALALATRQQRADAPAVPGQVLVAVTHGAAFGIDAATGKPLWRRYVGLGEAARGELDPWIVTDHPPGGLVLWDSVGQEVLCVDARSGRLRWRHPLGEEAAVRPVVAAGSVLAATRSGLLAILDLASGDAAGAVRLPQPPCVPPVIDAKRHLVFLAGRQQQIYAVSLADGRCRQVFSLGHASGSISARPVVWGDLLLVAVNDRLWASTLHVLSIGADESAPLASRQQIRLRGHVDVGPQCSQGRAVVATDCGAVYLFEVSAGGAGNSLKKISELPAAGAEGVVRFPIFDGDRLWVADTQLTAYALGVDGRLTLRRPSQPANTFQQPLAVSGRVLFHTRRRDGFSGLLVTAVDAGNGKAYWETTIGESPAAGFLVDAQGGTLTAATTAGALFRIDVASIKDCSVVDRPLAVWTPEASDVPTAALFALERGEPVLAGGAQSGEAAVLDLASSAPAFRRLQLPERATATPIGFGAGLLVAGATGQVALCEGKTGRMIGDPFQPARSAGTRCCWTAPMRAGKDRFAIVEGHDQRIYLVGVKSGLQPRLFELARAITAEPIGGPMAIAAGKTLYAADAAGNLAAFTLPGLQRDAVWPLGDRCTWGPWAVGDRVLLRSGRQKFWCFDGDEKRVWQRELPYGAPGGPPLVVGDHVLLAFAGGMVCRIDAASGKELSKINTGQTLASGPVMVGRRLFVGTLDGTLLEIKP
jgi:outer membrane protein assembly factor BamB